MDTPREAEVFGVESRGPLALRDGEGDVVEGHADL
jgi:hypothetical protein